MSGRRVHPASGRSYHVQFNPPKVDGVDDVTGDPLVQREDDAASTVKKRLEIYHAQAAQLISYYGDWASSDDAPAPAYRKIAGMGTVEQISERALAALQPLPG